jgi:hypothetical protein
VQAVQSTAAVVEIELGDDQRTWWAFEGAGVRGVLADHYDVPVTGDALPPSRDPARLRSQLLSAAPRLATLTERIRVAFGRDQACAVLIPQLGLGQLGLDDRRKGVFALAALLGDLTANIPLGHVVWDVRDQGGDASGHTSFSESDRRADYHTDNGALPIPEHFFLLYAVRAAACGGGVSLLRDARLVKHQLEATPAGRQAVRVLTETTFPRRIPRAFYP